MLLQVFQLILLDPFTIEKLVYLQKQYLKYTGGLIALTVYATILTTSLILTLPYTQSLTGWGITNGIYPSRGLRHKAELDHINVLELKAIETGFMHTVKTKSLYMSDLCVTM